MIEPSKFWCDIHGDGPSPDCDSTCPGPKYPHGTVEYDIFSHKQRTTMKSVKPQQPTQQAWTPVAG